MKGRLLFALSALFAVALLTWLWSKTQSVDPDDHAEIDSALRELRSLDRTINQDVLRARYQLVSTYHPVLQSYRRIEELEQVLASPPTYIAGEARQQLSRAVAGYSAAVTRKQTVIEAFKYRSAELRELLGHLPASGAGIAELTSAEGEARLSVLVTEHLQHMLVYNLSSDESLAEPLKKELAALSEAGEKSGSVAIRRRVRTFVLNSQRLLVLKPEVDTLLHQIFAEPVTAHEETVARTYYARYASAAAVANRYRLGMYGVSVLLLALVAAGVARLRHTAKELAAANERLEQRVQERTRELALRNLELRAVLDNVGQALFTVDLDGKVSRERSAALDRWFPEAAPGTSLWSALEPSDPVAAGWLRLGWEELRDDVLPRELVLEQLPKQVVASGRQYAFEYRPIEGDRGLEKVLVVASDVTENNERARREAEQQDQLAMFEHAMADPIGFEEFFNESARLVETARTSADAAEVLRALHTLKGNAAMYGLELVARTCHELEGQLVDTGTPLTASDKLTLGEIWESLAQRYRRLTGGSQRERLELTRGELQALRHAVRTESSSAELLRLLRQLEREPAERRLARVTEQVQSIARRLGKGDVVVQTTSNGARLDPERWSSFWAAFVHVLRNAIDHGIEPPDERRALGKPERGEVRLSIEHTGSEIVVEIRDDGRGVDWERLRARALERGMVAQTQADLEKVLLRGQISTKTSVSAVSGRGAGVAAVHAACVALGGNVRVTSNPGRGTTFRFEIPDDDTVAPACHSSPPPDQIGGRPLGLG